MTMGNLEQRLSSLNPQQLKDIYANLLQVLEPESIEIIEPDEIEHKENEDRSILEAFFSRIDMPVEGIVESEGRQIDMPKVIIQEPGDPTVDFLLKIAEISPEYGNEIETSLDELSSENISLDIQTAAAVLNPIIFAVAVALIKPCLKIDIKKDTKGRSKISEFHFDFQIKGTKDIVEAVKGLCSLFKES